MLGTLATRAIFREPFRDEPPRDASGSTILRYGRGIWMLGIVAGVVIPGGLALMQLVAPTRRPDQLPWLIACIVMFALLGSLVLVPAAQFSARVGPKGIESRPRFGRGRSLAWERIATVRFSAWRGALVFESADGVRVRLPIMAVGLPLLLDEMQNHLPASLYEEAVQRGLGQLVHAG